MTLTNISVIKDLLTRHDFAFAKSLGQNFLINPSVCPRIAESARGSRVIEIGAGIGTLTRALSKAADQVLAIEIDERLKPVLAETLADCANVEVLWGDVLETDLPALIAEKFGGEPVVICANLPYYAGTHIIMRLLEINSAAGKRLIKTLTVMVQEEVARRFTAEPCSKHYGIVSVAARFYGEPELLFRVSRGSFMPAPNVDSAVIRINVFAGENAAVDDERAFFKLVKAAFSERRKQLVNPVSRALGADKQRVKSALMLCGIDGGARAEELSLGDFTRVYNALRGEIT